MSDLFDVFFHQQAIGSNSGTVLFNIENSKKVVEQCEELYSQIVDGFLTLEEKKELIDKIDFPTSKKYIEIQSFKIELDQEVLVEKLAALFPQFIWTKMTEEPDESFNTYYCEFIPLAFDIRGVPIQVDLFESLKQMNISADQTISELVERKLTAILEKETLGERELSYPVEVSVIEQPKEKTRQKKKKKKRPVAKVEKPSLDLETIDNPNRSEKSEILFLKESLKQEKNAKQRMKISKDKLELDLLTAENSMLKSSLAQYRKISRTELEEAEWYKTIRIDFIRYDEICKKTKFLGKIWKLNKELNEAVAETQGKPSSSYDQEERVAKVKRKISETKMLTWIEQSRRIFERAKVRPGFLFIKPSVKLYKIDYEQLERMGTLFDIIQSENNFLERMLDESENRSEE